MSRDEISVDVQIEQGESTLDQPEVAPSLNSEMNVIELARRSNPDQLNSMSHKLHRAAMAGDWEAAKKIIDQNADLDPISVKLTGWGSTAIQIAAKSGRTEFVVEMVKILSDEQLKQKDGHGGDILHDVGVWSDVAAAKAILDRCPTMAQEKDNSGFSALYTTAFWRQRSRAKGMVEYLYAKTNIEDVCLDPVRSRHFIVAITAAGCYDIALEILQKHPELALASGTDIYQWSILHTIGTQPTAFGKEKKTIFPWMRFKSEKQNDATELVHFVCKELQKQGQPFIYKYFVSPETPTLQLSTKNGVFKLVILCLQYLPETIWYQKDSKGELLIHVAIKNRQVELFNHLMTLVGTCFSTYSWSAALDGNMLHLVAKLAPTPQLQSIAGPAFQLQRELQWFKGLEALIYNEQINATGPNNQRPIDIFYAEHIELIKDAKQWITDTSNSCMVVAALVATVAYASMITVPGGNDGSTGKPILSKKHVFVVFSISNAFSMISSAIALLMFLSLQTSRFTTEDYLATLPKNLLRGLLALFFAVATMMLAFGMTIGMELQTKVKWAYIPIAIVACIPTMIFTRLQLPLLFQTLGVTSGPTLFINQKNPRKYSLLQRQFDKIISKKCSA